MERDAVPGFAGASPTEQEIEAVARAIYHEDDCAILCDCPHDGWKEWRLEAVRAIKAYNSVRPT